jgi:DNA-binding MarR family transcriptional regulator
MHAILSRPSAGAAAANYLCRRAILLRMTADELLDALSTLRRVLRRRHERPVELTALTSAQVELVRLLRRHPGLSVAEAAHALRVAPNTVSTLVGRLVDAGVVVRQIDERDRRAVRLELAPSVRRRVQLWRDRRAAAVDEALAQLSPDERRLLDAAVPVLRRLAEVIDA